jgi:hypothetical protein
MDGGLRCGGERSKKNLRILSSGIIDDENDDEMMTINNYRGFIPFTFRFTCCALSREEKMRRDASANSSIQTVQYSSARFHYWRIN